eukprot:1204540-Rhodomonas_salina.2
MRRRIAELGAHLSPRAQPIAAHLVVARNVSTAHRKARRNQTEIPLVWHKVYRNDGLMQLIWGALTHSANTGPSCARTILGGAYAMSVPDIA